MDFIRQQRQSFKPISRAFSLLSTNNEHKLSSTSTLHTVQIKPGQNNLYRKIALVNVSLQFVHLLSLCFFSSWLLYLFALFWGVKIILVVILKP